MLSWYGGPSASANFGSSTWHLTKCLLTDLKRWELQWLRKAHRLRRRPGEGAMAHNSRTSRRICEWMGKSGRLMLHHRVLRAVFLHAWRQKTVPHQGFRQHCHSLDVFRDRAWWENVRAGPWRLRSASYLTQSTSGHPAEWEDVFVAVYGLRWREFRDSCNTLVE